MLEDQAQMEAPKSQIIITFAGVDSIAIADIVMQAVSPLQIIAVAALLELYAKSDIAETRAAKIQAIQNQEAAKRIAQPRIEVAKP